MPDHPADAEALRARIRALVAEYHAAAFAPRPFVAGESPVPVSGRVFGASELQHVVDAGLDFWLTTGRFATQFERAFAKVMGARHAMLVNSGSSANLLAVSALTSPMLEGRELHEGDEVITVAAGFPTTVNPIFQNRLVPVFVDVELPSYGIDVTQLEAARSPRTRAIIVAHTLGNPFDVGAVAEFAKRHGLFLIEDCCDAVGATFDGRSVGTFGDLATVSFYPAHHITMGEGGCVLAHKPIWKRIVESLRDWGRDCWCETGKENTCGKRFDWQLGDLPHGYDHKYTYSHVGYNLKLTDLQAAVGVAQLERLGDFVAARRRNFAHLRERLADLDDVLEFPGVHPKAVPSWFGFILRVRDEAPFERNALVRFLQSRKIDTRLLFGGNLVRQPAYRGLAFRVVGRLPRAEQVLRGSFWVGCYPGLSEEMLDYVAGSIREFARAGRAAHPRPAHAGEHRSP
ncbi:MAG TPA: lipopolysaccharide biosynthesis protein RfbH [Gemmatimonadaceae bacterium]|nr:lipopolysaccharide biosynthesis protein RfbH [Gemmatimonadaceae bacterium]